MSLIVGSWTAMVHIYQGLALRQHQLLSQKANIRKESDVFETNEHTRSISDREVTRESSRMSSGTRVVYGSSRSSTKNQRRAGR